MGIKAKLFELPNVTITFPDNSAPITNVRSVKIKRYPSYFKVTAFGDRNWSIRVKTAQSAAIIACGNITRWDECKNTPGVYSVSGSHDLPTVQAIENLPIYADDEPAKTVKDFGSIDVEAEIKEVTKKNKENKTMNQINVINGAITFEKELAFAVNGKYKTVTKDGVLKEVLPQFVIAKDIPALIPTVAKKIEAGNFYSANGKLYKALADNKVIDLDTGIIAEIAVASIPMTDAVIVYKPAISGDGKIGMKDIMKAQMLSKMGGDNPLMMMTLLDDGDDTDMKDVMMMSMLNNGGKGIDNNALLPLMFLKDGDKDEDSSLEDILLLQSLSGKAADANALSPLLMMTMLKKDKKAKKAVKAD